MIIPHVPLPALLEQAKGSIERIIASYDEKLRVADNERRRLVREAADSRAAAEDLRARLEEANNARDAQGRQIDHLNDVVHQLEREVQAYVGPHHWLRTCRRRRGGGGV